MRRPEIQAFSSTAVYAQGTRRRLILANEDCCRMAKRGVDVFKASGFRDEQGCGIGGWDVTQSAKILAPECGRLHCMVGRMNNEGT